MTQHKHTNNLIHETSPYLLQHAHNPVHWFAWGDDALKKAKEEDKPILISIGYSACHWCHVMAHESFEDEETAQVMNAHFINIKIDREERPDIDHIYMDALQAITGSGGWPLNIFLTPDLKPFYGGTYYPPVRAFNRSSWTEVLLAVTNAYKEKRNEITEQAENLTQHLLNANNLTANNEAGSFSQTSLNTIAENLINASDKEWGGFGQAPKFPQTFSILYLLRHYYLDEDENALQTAMHALDKMMLGGMYDHLGGGFCRYSTDKRWQIPHFEKMLYDNALLIDVYSEAYQLTNKEEYANVIKETIAFIKREMTSPEGGFYSALDADSEGVEGKYYTWSKKEIDALLGTESGLFCKAYNISEKGNWEYTNIIWLPESLEKIIEESGISKDELTQQLNASKKILFDARQNRIRPGLDNKVLAGWNALMITALCKAYAALQEDGFLQLAETNIAFIETKLFNNDNELLHSWNKTVNPQAAFLDDYAALTQAYIFLQQSTGNNAYLLKAKSLTEKAIEIFSDEQETFFYFTSQSQTDVLIRKVEIYDGATPSGNSLMANNLLMLSVYFNIPEWKIRAEKMLLYIKKLSEKYPTSFGVWNLDLQVLQAGFKEIVLMAPHYSETLKKLLHEYIPHKILQASSVEDSEWPMTKNKTITPNKIKIYVCENYACLKPAESLEQFKEQTAKTFLTKKAAL